MSEDELMEELGEIHDVSFQFDEDEPVRIAFVMGGEFSLTLKTGETEDPSVIFSDGKGKTFKLFLHKSP